MDGWLFDGGFLGVGINVPRNCLLKMGCVEEICGQYVEGVGGWEQDGIAVSLLSGCRVIPSRPYKSTTLEQQEGIAEFNLSGYRGIFS